MDRNRHHRPTEESQQLPLAEDEQRMSEEYFSLESSPSSNDGPVASSQESSEYSSRTQLHPQSGLAVRTSSRVLYYTSVETLPESISSGATLDPSGDSNLPREALYSHTEDVVESEIPSQDVGASALEREMSHEPLRCGIATSEETQGPNDKALDPPGPSRRLGDHLQEFISKYSAEFHAIISDFSNFVKIVRLFTDHPNVLLGIIQIFIDNPELVRSTSQDAELTLPPDQLALNRRGSSSGASGSDRNPEAAGGSTVPNPPQSLSDDLGRTEGNLNAHINLLTKLDELKKMLLHLQDRNHQGGNVKSGPDRRILGDSNAALKRSDQLEIESPSWKAEDSSKDPRPVASRKPSDHRKQGSEDRSTLPAAPDANVEQLCADHYLTKDSVTKQKSHQSELDFLSQEVGKSSGEQQIETSREGVIKWVFKPTDSRNSDVPSDSSSSENSPRKDKKILQDPCDLDYGQTQPSRRLLDNQQHPAVLQASDESEIECPSRKVGTFSKKPQPGSSSRFSAPDENAPQHRTDRHFTTDSGSVKKSRPSELSLLSQEVGESGKEQQLESSEGVIKWFFTATDSRSSDVPSGPSSPERPIHKDGKSLEHTRTDKKEPQFSSHSQFDEPDFSKSKRPSDNRKHAPVPKRSDDSEIEFSSRKVGEPCEEPKAGHSRRLLDHGKQSSEDRSSLSAAPEGSVEQYCADRSSTKDSAAEQKLRQSESKFLLQEVGEPGSLPCQFTDLVTEQAVKWFFKFSDTTISVVDSNAPCSERAATKDVKSPKDNHEQKKKTQGPCYIASNQPGPSKKLLGNQEPAASLDSSGESEIDFLSQKVGKFSKELQPGPRRKFSEHQKKISEGRSGLPIAPEENVEHRQGELSLDRRKQSSEDRSHLPTAPDANVELQFADHYSAEDIADRPESHQSELEVSSEEVGGSGEEQPPEASKGHPSSPTTDLLTDEVVKWFFDLNNSIRLIVQSDICSESTAPTDIISSEPIYTRNEEPQDPCHLAFDQSGSDVRKHAATLETLGESDIEFPSQKLRGSSDEPQAGPSRRSSEHQEQISESRSGLPKAPHENTEHRQEYCYSTKDSAARKKSQKSKTKFASKEVRESSGEQLPGSKEGHFLTPSTDLLKGKVFKDSSRRVGKDFKSEATGQDLPLPTPEEKSSPQLLNVGNVNELMGHLNPPPIPTSPCNVCHLRPMKFQELNFWYELHWKLVIDGGEREFESQAKPIVLVNSIESDEYFQDIKSKMPNPDEDSDRAHQKPHKYKKGKKEKKRNF